MNSIVHEILQNNSIVDYLENQGITPDKICSGKLLYKCPFPDHKETKPSFVVYINGEFENFYCFGCQRRYHIIHLVSQLENMSIKDTIKKLSGGKVASEYDELKYLIDKRTKEQNITCYEPQGLVERLLTLSNICRLYEKGVDKDNQEIKRIDGLWKIIDECILDNDFDTVIEHVSPEFLRKKLINQRKIFERNKRRKQIENILQPSL